MATLSPLVISAAVEGLLDEAVVKRLILQVGAESGPVYGKNGKSSVRNKINGYNMAARFSPWLALVDLNHEAECAPPLKAAWLPNPAPLMCFRVAVREIEAWLLADRERFSSFFKIPLPIIPTNPESISDPKKEVVLLAAKSGQSEIHKDMVPRPESGRMVGPAYTSRLIEFVSNRKMGWRPEQAAKVSDSLRRCLAALGRLAAGQK